LSNEESAFERSLANRNYESDAKARERANTFLFIGAMASFGGNVRKRREQLGLTQTELADRIGVNQAEISRIERGRRNPTISAVFELNAALGVNLFEYFGELNSHWKKPSK
jgi:ribosome-binding protein aMBF1 (putative translation factor)